MLVHVAVALIGLMAFGSFVVDYGVLWTARRQAQNAADAAALAAAASLGFGGGDEARARSAAIEASRANMVWGEPPDMTGTDVSFDACPAGSPEAGAGRCVRADVYRNQQRGNPLPTILGGLVGIVDQGVRATATAEVLYANATSCVKPLAILDRWIEVQTPPWNPTTTFDRYEPAPPAAPGTLLPNPDSYVAATPGNNGSGFDLSVDYGLQLRLARRIGPPPPPDRVDWYIPVQLDCPGATFGTAECVLWNIANCSPQTAGPDDVVPLQTVGVPAEMLGPALAGLVVADASAVWDTGANGGRGGIAGGCMASGACAVSPRIVAVPMVNPEVWADQNVDPLVPASSVTVTRVVGLFVEEVNGTEILGRLMPYPIAPTATTVDNLGVPGSAFVVSTILVR